MKVAGIKMTDPWASRALRTRGVRSEQVTGAPAETVVQMERVAFEHHGPEKNYRPLLHLTGELRSIIPTEALPHGVREVTFRAGLGPTVDAFYEFDDNQLAELVSKGYFTEGFEPPATMAGIPWDLPTTIDALVLAPEHEGDTPVVFVTINGQTELALDAENSGYDLAVYFEDRLTVEASQERVKATAPQGVPTRSGEINDLFANEKFTAPEAARGFASGATPGSADYPVVRTSLFEGLMSEVAEKAAAEDQSPEDSAHQEEVPSTQLTADPIESIYEQRIAPGVEQALHRTSEGAGAVDEHLSKETPAIAALDQTLKADNGLLDLYSEETELDVVPLATEPVTEEVWVPDTANEDSADHSEKPTRRVQRALEHERALELDRDESEPGHELV